VEKWPYVIQGDVEAALIEIIRTAPEISGFPGGAPNVSTTLDGFNEGMRWITVSAEGGSFKFPILIRARIDINVFAETRTIAHDIAQIAFAVLFREQGQPSPNHGLRIHRHRVETGLVRADDKINDTPRYLFSLRSHFVPYDAYAS
jgi:hypothetical protein